MPRANQPSDLSTENKKSRPASLVIQIIIYGPEDGKNAYTNGFKSDDIPDRILRKTTNFIPHWVLRKLNEGIRMCINNQIGMFLYLVFNQSL